MCLLHTKTIRIGIRQLYLHTSLYNKDSCSHLCFYDIDLLFPARVQISIKKVACPNNLKKGFNVILMFSRERV